MSFKAGYLYVLSFVLAASLVACGGVAEPPIDATGGTPDPSVPQTTPAPDSYGLTDLVDDLQAVGLTIEAAEGYPPSILTPPIQSLMVNGEPIAIRQYEDTATAETEAGWISPSGDQITQPDPDNPGSEIVAMMEPAGTPHWFQNANVIVLYAGDSRITLDGLSAALGPQFAGGPVPAEDAFPTHYRLTWELPVPRTTYVGDVLMPPAWLGVPGQATATLGAPGGFNIGVLEGVTGTTTIGEAAPIGLEALPAVNLAEQESANVIIFIPYGAVQEIDVEFGEWPRELVSPDYKPLLAGTADQRGELYAYTLEPAGQLVDQIMQVTVEFSYETTAGTVSYYWLFNPSVERLAESQAQATLQAFFDNLRNGSYAEAAELFGGSYDALVEYNPDLNPQERAGLLENACTINGFQCLRPMSVTLETNATDTYVFQVEFETADGSLFVLGPCCGADESKPPQSHFSFTVVADGEGGFLVQELPPYLP